jgi:dsRNA-specific ribonuclease
MDTSSHLSTLIESSLAELSSKQAQVTTAYDYEQTFAEWCTALGKEVFQARLTENQEASHSKKNS